LACCSLCHNLIMNPIKLSDRVPLRPNDWSVFGQWPPKWRWPTDYRIIMCIAFAVGSLLSLSNILYNVHRIYVFPLLRNVLIGPMFSVCTVAFFGMASWTIWKGKSWARGWAIAASLMYVLMFFRQFIIPVRPAWDHHVGMLFIGILGLVCFVWRDNPVAASPSGSANS
jgi:hypothetical protein